MPGQGQGPRGAWLKVQHRTPEREVPVQETFPPSRPDLACLALVRFMVLHLIGLGLNDELDITIRQA